VGNVGVNDGPYDLVSVMRGGVLVLLGVACCCLLLLVVRVVGTWCVYNCQQCPNVFVKHIITLVQYLSKTYIVLLRIFALLTLSLL